MSRTPLLDKRAQEAVYASYQAGVGTQEELGQIFHVSRYVIQRILGRAAATASDKENSNDGK